MLVDCSLWIAADCRTYGPVLTLLKEFLLLSFFFFFCVGVFETGSLFSPVCLESHRDLPASTSPQLALKTTMSCEFLFLVAAGYILMLFSHLIYELKNIFELSFGTPVKLGQFHSCFLSLSLSVVYPAWIHGCVSVNLSIEVVILPFYDVFR